MEVDLIDYEDSSSTSNIFCKEKGRTNNPFSEIEMFSIRVQTNDLDIDIYINESPPCS